MLGPQLASDNWSGLCPEAFEYLAMANIGSQPPYGQDDWSQRTADWIRDWFETDAEVFFTLTGTAANSLSLAHLCQPFQAVICHKWSHIETDECSAPGFFTQGARLLLGEGKNGQLDTDELQRLAQPPNDLRFPRAAVLSLTQSTEVGTLYAPDQLVELTQLAKAHDMRIHMDGARFMNAVVALNVSPAELTWKSGVDVISLGASKMGGGIGDMVIFFDRQLAQGFAYRCKQAGQLPAKMRMLTAPLLGLLESGAWQRNSNHANACAAYLESRLAVLGICPAFPRQANAVFIHLSEQQAAALKQSGWNFHVSNQHGAARFVCGWDSTIEQIDALLTAFGQFLAA